VLKSFLAFHDLRWTPTVGLTFSIMFVSAISISRYSSRRESILCNFGFTVNYFPLSSCKHFVRFEGGSTVGVVASKFVQSWIL
jgi:hypothetical protein